MNTSNLLITCIIERGRAEEVMRVARKAGAKGGTVLPARGTGTDDDKKFLGISVMPTEKEMLLIVAEQALATAIMDAMRTLPACSKPGGSVIFTTQIGEFFTPGSYT